MGVFLLVTWTIRINEQLDKLVNSNIRDLGYTSKAELVREAVREFILKQNLGRLGLRTTDRLKTATVDPDEALARLAAITKDVNAVDQILSEERQAIEDALLRIEKRP